MTPTKRRPMFGVLVAAVTSLVLVGCGVSVPADPEGTLDRAREGELRVGATAHDDRVTIEDDGTPTGPDVQLAKGFAASIDAEIAWTVGSEESLVRELERGGLDLVIGGITDESPWADQAGMTRPYDEITGGDGQRLKLVMLTPRGENAFLTELERYLTEHGRSKDGER